MDATGESEGGTVDGRGTGVRTLRPNECTALTVSDDGDRMEDDGGDGGTTATSQGAVAATVMR